MTQIRSRQARQLCTVNEFDLFRQSQPPLLRKLTPAQLRAKVSRSRKLRDKYRDLAHRQRREARGKQQPRGTRASQGNERTIQKVDLFSQMMGRFEDRLKALETAAKKESKKSSTAKKKKTGGARKKTAKPKTSSARVRAEKDDIPEKAAEAAAKPKKSSRAKTATRSIMEMLAATPPPRELKGRAARRKSKSRTSDSPTRKDIWESGASKKIKGHVSGATKRAQGRRDAK
jgi:hypothetical protein